MNNTKHEDLFSVLIQSTSSIEGFIRDVRLVKVMALYGDEIRLSSFFPAFVSVMYRVSSRRLGTKVDLLEFSRSWANLAVDYADEADSFDPAEFASAVQDLIRADESGLLKLRGLPHMWDLVFESHAQTGDSSEWDPLTDVSYAREIAAKRIDAKWLQRAMREELAAMLSVFASRQTYFPFFDDFLSGWAHRLNEILDELPKDGRSAIRSTMDRAKHAQLVSDLFERLPQLGDVPFDELVEIRRELEQPLVRFRSGMLKISRDIQSEPWTSDFPHEVSLLVSQEIAPALLDIEEQVKANTYVERLSRKLLREPLDVAKSSAIGLGVGTLASLPAAMSAALGVGLGAAITAYEVFNQWEEANKQVRRNNMYFYYAARQKLSHRKRGEG